MNPSTLAMGWKCVSISAVLWGLEVSNKEQFSNFSLWTILKTSLLAPKLCSSNPSRINKHLSLNCSRTFRNFCREMPSSSIQRFWFTIAVSMVSSSLTNFRKTTNTRSNLSKLFLAQSQAIFLDNVVLPMPGSPLAYTLQSHCRTTPCNFSART